jgi:hypothetical protein
MSAPIVPMIWIESFSPLLLLLKILNCSDDISVFPTKKAVFAFSSLIEISSIFFIGSE